MSCNLATRHTSVLPLHEHIVRDHSCDGRHRPTGARLYAENILEVVSERILSITTAEWYFNDRGMTIQSPVVKDSRSVLCLTIAAT